MKYTATGYLGTGYAGIEITADRYAQIKRARQVCLFALELEEKFALLVSNYIALESELLRQAQEHLIRRHRSHSDAMLDRLSLDRHFVNYLTSCRLYNDQTDHGISQLFGNPSQQLDDVKAFKSAQYDSTWGYRFMEALRNHVQHSGLPVNSISHSVSRSPGKGPDYAEYYVVPKAQIRSLRENADFKMSILDELPKDQKEIDLRQPAREYMTCFFRVHNQLRRTIANEVAESRPVYLRAISDYSSHEGQTIHFPMIISQEDDGPITETVALVTDFLDYYDDLMKRNTVSEDIRLSTASNSTQEKA